MSETPLINDTLGVMFHFGLRFVVVSRSSFVLQIHTKLVSLYLIPFSRKEMTSALTAMATHVPSMFPDIQERLLNLISMVLTKKSYDAAMTDSGSQNQIHVDAPVSALKSFASSTKQKSSIRKRFIPPLF